MITNKQELLNAMKKLIPGNNGGAYITMLADDSREVVPENLITWTPRHFILELEANPELPRLPEPVQYLLDEARGRRFPSIRIRPGGYSDMTVAIECCLALAAHASIEHEWWVRERHVCLMCGSGIAYALRETHELIADLLRLHLPDLLNRSRAHFEQASDIAIPDRVLDQQYAERFGNAMSSEEAATRARILIQLMIASGGTDELREHASETERRRLQQIIRDRTGGVKDFPCLAR